MDLSKFIEFCKCGCGKEVNEGNLYVHGHNRRGLASNTSGEKWSMKYNCCISCGAKDHKHQGSGLCARCYSKNFYKIKKIQLGSWSRQYDCCVDCGRADRPHAANGRCGACSSNNINRQKGIKKRNIGSWSWYYDKCQKCDTTERPHAAKGLCCDCNEASKRDLSGDYEICPVCGAEVVKLNQHMSMRAKKCEDHKKYQHDLFEIYFKSDLSVYDIAEELKTDRHAVTRNFSKFFGKKETEERNKRVSRCVMSEKAALNYNPNNKRGTVAYYDSLNNGKVRFRSKLEKQFAEFLDRSGVRWVYEHKRFPYIDREGKRRTYTPDFYFVDDDRYIEIKGYERENDRHKVNTLIKAGINIKMIGKGEFESALI